MDRNFVQSNIDRTNNWSDGHRRQGHEKDRLNLCINDKDGQNDPQIRGFT